VITPTGSVDIVGTLTKLPTTKPSFLLLVTERDGSEYQDTKNFRPSPV